MPALSSLVLLTMLVPSPAARAGSWKYVVTGDNTGTTFTDSGKPGYAPSYSPATSGSGSGVTLPGYNIERGSNGSFGSGCDIHVIVHAQITFTWVPAGTNDPPPPNVLVLESANAGWTANSGDAQHPGTVSGTTTDGLNDAEADVYQSPYSETGGSASYQNPNHALLIGEHLTVCSSSSGTVALPTRTLESRATAVCPNWGYGASAGFGSYAASIHPQPYNFRRTNFSNETPPTSVVATAGELQFHYNWSSTTGDMSQLSGETIHENVDAPSSPSSTDASGHVYFLPDDPPFNWTPSVHFDSVGVAATSTDGITDDHMWGNGQASLSDCFTTPYKADSFALTQTYKFNDPATMANGVEQIIPGDAGPFTITDAVVLDSSSPSGYSFKVTKDNTTSLPQPLP